MEMLLGEYSPSKEAEQGVPADRHLCTWTDSRPSKQLMILCQLPAGVTEVVNCAYIEIINCFTRSTSADALHHQVADTTT